MNISHLLSRSYAKKTLFFDMWFLKYSVYYYYFCLFMIFCGCCTLYFNVNSGCPQTFLRIEKLHSQIPRCPKQICQKNLSELDHSKLYYFCSSLFIVIVCFSDILVLKYIWINLHLFLIHICST